MSWISGLTDRAENILNKLDRNAAAALKVQSNSLSSHAVCSEEETTETQEACVKTDWLPVNIEGENNVLTTTDAPMECMSNIAQHDHKLMKFKMGRAAATKDHDDLRLRLDALVQDVEVSTLKQRVRDLEALTQNLRTERDKAKGKLEESQLACAAHLRSILELESNLSKLKQEYRCATKNLELQVEEAKQQSEYLQESHTEDQHTLLMKDSTVVSVKDNDCPHTVATGHGHNEEQHLLKIEIHTLRRAHQNLLEENAGLRHQLEEAHEDLNVLKNLNSEMSASRQAYEELRKTGRIERERLVQLESENRILRQEVLALRQGLHGQEADSIVASQLRVEPKKRNTDAELSECNMRIRSLTQSLVEKQTSLEHITADRNALRIQLEKLQDQMQQRTYESNNSFHNLPRTLLSNTTDDVKAQLPALMRESPFDSRISRRVKRACSSLSSAGIRLGALLRRYPFARVIVLMYVGLLHIWVIFVLLSSTPT